MDSLHGIVSSKMASKTISRPRRLLACRSSFIRLLPLLIVLSFFIPGVFSQDNPTPTGTSFYDMNNFIPKAGVTINAYDVNENLLFPVAADELKNLNITNYPQLESVSYYIVGIGPTYLEVWSPFKENGDAKMAAAFLLAMNDFVYNNRNGTSDTLRIKLYVGGWDNNNLVICNPLPCPDVMILGTTQIAGQAYNGNIISLEPYFAQYTQENNRLIIDSFTKYTFYDYSLNNLWYGVPLTTDIRLAFYNITTFNKLGLKPPPPDGDWGTEWWNTWNWAQFVNYTTLIRNSGYGYGLDFKGQWDEETKLMSMIARNYNIDIISQNGTCVLDSPGFNDVLDYVIRPLFLPTQGTNGQYSTVVNPDFYNTTTPGFSAWTKVPLSANNSVDPTIFCCEYDSESNDELPTFMGIKVDTPENYNYTYIWASDAANNSTNTTNPYSDIGIGFAPGVSTFLGGVGMTITKGSKNPDIAWQLIGHFINQNAATPYLNIINIANGLFPPYDSALDFPPWNSPAYSTVKSALSHAVPIQYPLTAVPQMGNIEAAHVFRQLILEMVIKNATNQQAVSSACQTLDTILAPLCTVDDFNFTQPQFCTASTQTLDLAYYWNTPHICLNGTAKPDIFSLPCAYVPTTSPAGFAITVLTAFGSLMTVIFMIMFFIYRNSSPIKMASFIFCEFILLGSLLMYSTLFFMVGYPAPWRCNVTIWVLVIGFGLSFGGLFVKLLRIYKIFSNKGLQTLRLTDSFLFKRLMGIIVLEIVALLIWTFLDGGPQVRSVYIGTETYLGTNIYQDSCGYGSPATMAILGVLNLVLIILAVGIAFATWSVPTQFNETKAVITAVFGVSFGCVVCVPLLFFVQSATKVMLIGLTIDFVLLISMAIFCVPKLYEAIRPGYRRWRRNSHATPKPWWVFWRTGNTTASEESTTKSTKSAAGPTAGQQKSTTVNSSKTRATSNRRNSKSSRITRDNDNDVERLPLSEVFENEAESDIGSISPIPLSPVMPRNLISSPYGRSTSNLGDDREAGPPRMLFTVQRRPSHSYCPHCGLGLRENSSG